MLLCEAVECFLLHRRLKGVCNGTLVLYRRWLGFWSSWREEKGLPPSVQEVAIEDIRAFLFYLLNEHTPHSHNAHRPTCHERRGLSESSVESCWKTIHTFWCYMVGEGLLSEEQKGFYKNNRIPRPKVKEQIRSACDHETLNVLLSVCDNQEEEGARNCAILLMLHESGMRVAELCSLFDTDVDLNGRMAIITGKGGQQRYVFWGPTTDVALRKYLPLRRGKVDGPLFRGCSSTNNGGQLTTNAVRAKIKRIAEQAKVQLPENAPVHWMRHGFARSVLDAGVDGLYLQQLLGHKKIETTMRYVREHPKKLKEVHRKIYG